MAMAEVKKLRKENKALKETCRILADNKLMEDIRKSLRQIAKGRCKTFSAWFLSMYKVVYSELFEKELCSLEKSIQERVRKILIILETRLIGIPLKGDLKGFYSVHFERNRYRLIYTVSKTAIQVLVVHVGKRTERFYADFQKKRWLTSQLSTVL